jgi:pyruvate,water dikinase
MSELVIGLTGQDRDQEAVVGVKAAGLGALISAGIPVPEAFVVTVPAFRRARTRSGDEDQEPSCEPRPETGYRSPAPYDEEQGERIRSRPIPDEIAGTVLQAYRAWGTGDGQALVAVRSSSVFEDTSQASHAGQLTSTLAVSGEQALLDAIRDCWAGASSPRVLSYRRGHGGPWRGFDTAVIVQRMVDAVSSGVLFTCEPATGEDTPVIEGTWGLGIGVVEGQVVPDSWVVHRGDGSIHRHRIGSKRHRFVLLPGEDGAHQEETPELLSGTACLNPDQVRDLTSLGLRIERALGHRVDVEWALGRPAAAVPSQGAVDPARTTEAEDALWILQARPVTTPTDHGMAVPPVMRPQGRYGTSPSSR